MVFLKNILVLLTLLLAVSLSAQDIKVLQLRLTDIVYVPSEDRIYGSAPGDRATGNALVVVNPSTGIIEQRYPIGSEPKQLALSSDGHYLYVVLAGAPFIRRFNLLTHTVEQDQYLKTIYQNGSHEPRTTLALAPLPGQPKSLAVSLFYTGLFVYDNGVARPDSAATYTSFKSLVVDDAGQFAYAAKSDYQNGGIAKYAIGPNGISLVGDFPDLLTGNTFDIERKGQRLYAENGEVFSIAGAAPVKLGNLKDGLDPGQTLWQAIEPAPDSAVVYAAVQKNVGPDYGFFLQTYNQNTFGLQSEIPLPMIMSGNLVLDLIHWGNGGRVALLNKNDYNDPVLGYQESNQLIIIRSCTAPPPANLGISPPSSLSACVGDTLTLHATTPGFAQYLWSNGATGTTIKVPVVYGPLSLSYRAMQADGCQTNASQSITITGIFSPGPPAVYSSSSNNPPLLCGNQPITLYAAGSTSNFLWSTGETGSSITVTQPGTYSAMAIADGCISKTPGLITLLASPESIPPAPVVSIEGNLVLCSGQAVRLSVPPGYARYEWTNGENTPSIFVGYSGQFAARYINASGCPSPWFEPPVVVQVNQSPGQPFVMVNGNVLSSFSTGFHQWFFNGQPVGNGPTLTMDAPGFYSLQVAENGCWSPMSSLFSLQTVGTHEPVALHLLTSFPNPTTGLVQFQWPGEKVPTAPLLTDALGQQLGYGSIKHLHDANWELDLSGFPSGWYFVRWAGEEGAMWGLRVLKM